METNPFLSHFIIPVLREFVKGIADDFGISSICAIVCAICNVKYAIAIPT